MVNLNNPLIVQSDGSLLLEVHSPRYEAARDALGRFAELEKSPEHIHTYRVTPLSLWNAAAAGAQVNDVIATLEAFAKYGVPQNVAANVRDWLGRYGKLRLLPGGASLRLEIDDPLIGHEIEKNPTTAPLLRRDGNVLYIDPLQRGTVKQRLARWAIRSTIRWAFARGRSELRLAGHHPRRPTVRLAPLPRRGGAGVHGQ